MITGQSRRIRNIVNLALVLVILGVPLGASSEVQAQGLFIVNSELDTAAQDNYLTLREAIMVANGAHTGAFSAAEKDLVGGPCIWEEYPALSGNWYINGGACGFGHYDTITFHPSVNQITLNSCLQNLADAGDTIDGGSPVHVTIDASGCNGNTFTIDDDGITIQYLSIINTAPGYNDILVKSGSRAEIANNLLGLEYTSTSCDASRNGDNGVAVVHTTSGSLGVGLGSAYIYHNVIGCHGYHGVYIDGADYVYVGADPSETIQENYIGLHSDYSIPNGYDGVSIMDYYSNQAKFNHISNNWIANNGRDGVRVEKSANNYIQGNIIGLGISGAAAPNAEDGVRISGSNAGYNTIGALGTVHSSRSSSLYHFNSFN